MDQQPGPPAAPGGTRELILEAARAEIAALGYDAATVRSIARRAGVDPRLVRYYFADKRGLATAALGEFDLLAALDVERGARRRRVRRPGGPGGLHGRHQRPRRTRPQSRHRPRRPPGAAGLRPAHRHL